MCSIWLLLSIKKAFHYFITELEIVYWFIYIKNKLKGNFESGIFWKSILNFNFYLRKFESWIFIKVHFELQFLSKEIMNLEYLLKSISNYNFYLIEKKLLLIVKMIYILQNSDFNVTCREFIPLYSVLCSFVKH